MFKTCLHTTFNDGERFVHRRETSYFPAGNPARREGTALVRRQGRD